MAHDDRMLLEQWSEQGDGEAFGALVSRYGAMVYGACRRILGNPADAEDIAQECFEALATAGTKPGSYVGAWLHRVATYHAISHVRSDVRRRQREILYATARQAEHEVEWKDIYAYVDEAIDELPEKLRSPLIAHFLEGQSKEAVGRALGLSRQLASHRIERGLGCVRAALQRKGISVGALLLASLMGAHAAEAMPAALAAQLGKIALAGPHISATVAASAAARAASSLAAGASAFKVTGAVAAIAAVVAVALFIGWKVMTPPYPTQDITKASTFTVAPLVPIENDPASAASQEGETETEPPASSASGPVQTLEPGTIVYGVVLDEQLRVVPNATVMLDNREQVEAHARAKRLGVAGASDAVASVELHQTTDARGEFVFERAAVSEGPGGLVLAAHAGDRHAVQTFCVFGELRQRRHELILAPAGLVKGRIVDEQNKGVPDVVINLPSMFRPGTASHGLYLITQEDGSFASRPLPYGQYRLYFKVPGFKDPGQPWVNADGQAHVIRLERDGPAGSISGWVTGGKGGPRLPGFQVMAIHPDDTGMYRFSDTTNEKGEFHITGVPAIEYRLRLGKQNEPYCLAESPAIKLTRGQDVADVELVAIQGVSVSGRILDGETKQPVPKTYIGVFSEEQSMESSAKADEKGQYTLAGLVPGKYEVGLGVPGSYEVCKRTFTLASFTDMIGVDFILGPLPSVRGRVINASGTPVAGASVAVLDPAYNTRISPLQVTDAFGGFSAALRKEVPSVYLQAYGDGSVSRCLGPILPGASCELKLERSGAIEGTVVDSAGQAVPKAIVLAVPENLEMITAISPDGSEWSPQSGLQGTKTRTAATGAFQMEPVLPGKHRLEVYLLASTRGYPVAVATATVQPGRTLQARLVVDVSALSTIEGTVTQGGSPLAHGRVEAFSGRDGTFETCTDANGAYAFANVCPGKLQVVAFESGAANREIRKEIELAENEARIIDFTFEPQEGGVEGTVTINGKPAHAVIFVKSSGSETGVAFSSTETDRADGYYHVTDLAPGTYTVIARNQGLANRLGTTVPRESTVQISGDETVRCDFILESGAVEGMALGLRDGEKAVVGLFTEPIDIGTVSASSMDSLGEQVVSFMELQPGQPFRWEDLEPGIYYLGAIALPAGEETNEETMGASLAQQRFATQQIEVVAGEISTVEIALPDGHNH